jgi:hypothetical protein
MAKKTKSTHFKGEVKYLNPDGLPKNPAFTNVVTVTGPVKTVYIGGQDAVDTSGAIVGKGDLKAQTEQIQKTSTSSVDAGGAHLSTTSGRKEVQGSSAEGFCAQRSGNVPIHPRSSGMFVAA